MNSQPTTLLLAALQLADKVSPTPAEAHRALRLLRAAYADACALPVDELTSQAVRFEPTPDSALACEITRQLSE